MRRQAERDTIPEMRIRRALHARGLRYFVHRRPIGTLRRTADIVFPRQRVAIFVNGCFWHGCPEHASWPVTNSAFWKTKIEDNRARDRQTKRLLSAAGWRVIDVWEHDEAAIAVDSIQRVLRGRGA